MEFSELIQKLAERFRRGVYTGRSRQTMCDKT